MTGTSGHAHAEEQLAHELAVLRHRRDELAASISDRDPVGDTADSANALERADDLAWLNDRIGKLSEQLATWSANEPGDADALPDGTEVTLRWPDGEEEKMLVVAITAEIAEGAEDTTITRHSALGRALAGHSKGDEISYTTPDGEHKVTLVSIKKPRRRR